jgi:hypothetical protein
MVFMESVKVFHLGYNPDFDISLLMMWIGLMA